MVTHRTGSPGLRASAVTLLVAVAIPACAAPGRPGGPHAPPTRAAAPAAEPIYATPVPGVPDSIYDAVVVFTRRLPTTGEAVAFAFTPQEATTGGNLVGDLSYTGRRASGRVERVFAAVSFSAGEGGACGRVALWPDLDAALRSIGPTD